MICPRTERRGVLYKESLVTKTRHADAVLRKLGSSTSSNLVDPIIWNEAWADIVGLYKEKLAPAGFTVLEKVVDRGLLQDSTPAEIEKNMQPQAPLFMKPNDRVSDDMEDSKYWYLPNQRVGENTLAKLVRNVCIPLGMKGVISNSVGRVTLACTLAASGISSAAAMGITGHTSLNAFRAYSNRNDNAAAMAASDFLTSALPMGNTNSDALPPAITADGPHLGLAPVAGPMTPEGLPVGMQQPLALPPPIIPSSVTAASATPKDLEVQSESDAERVRAIIPVELQSLSSGEVQHVKQFSCPSPATTAVTAASGADDSFSLTLDDENTGEGEKKLAARKAAAFCSRVPFKKRRGNVDRSPLASLDNKTVATPASTLSTTSEISNIHNTVIRNYAGDAAPVIPSSASARRTTMDIETMIRAVDSRRPFLFFPGSCSQDFTQ